MAKFKADKIEEYRKIIEVHAEANGIDISKITTETQAWMIAKNAGVINAMYRFDPDVRDAHIQTALGKIFPNAEMNHHQRY